MANSISTALLDYLELRLTNINIKCFALASQSLSFFIALISYVREYIHHQPSTTGSGILGYNYLKRFFQDQHDRTIQRGHTRVSCFRVRKQGGRDDSTDVYDIL
ncbi:hypothetical protein PISL3812_03444 [Talaromyces islandicus]|uniref:Vacuolar protein sorting-associated protein 54 C-terminal domain-containing protein n=1 Tax=Talaromyces islandicus TaxID=28573 RepID=A0A0U1LSR9_TALIS|nr:hypothetical protein PISL3812_03444 [Talaromyces islandicus]